MYANRDWLRVDRKKCKRCFNCIRSCPSGALTLDMGIFKLNKMKCRFCNKCRDACESGALTYVE